MTARISQGLEETHTSQGKEYSIEYYCASDNDVSSIMQNVYAVANWTGSAYARVSMATKRSVGVSGPPYIVRMTSVPADASNTNDPRNQSDLGNQKMERLSVGEIYIEPAWFSLKKATTEDVGKKNLEDNACVAGEWIYTNATTVSKGSANSKLSPLTGSYTDSNLLNVIEKVFRTITYEVTVNTKTSIASFLNDIDTIPGNTTPPGGSASWHIKDKQANSTYDINGTAWLQINIKWEKLPDELIAIGFSGWK